MLQICTVCKSVFWFFFNLNVKHMIYYKFTVRNCQEITFINVIVKLSLDLNAENVN